MRAGRLLSIFLLTTVLAACDPKPVDLDDSTPPEGDTDTDADTDSDADGDTDPTPLVAWVVRHAEKDEGHDPHLTEEGMARAEALVSVMADVPLVAIYATGYNRTQETCQPTADDHGIELVTDIDPEWELAAHIIDQHQHEQILHCGHSWTIPDFMGALGVEDDISVGSNDFGDIWIVSMMGDEVLSVEMSQFGE